MLTELFYITSSASKLLVAQKYLAPLHITVTQKSLNLSEIQSMDLKKIAIHKAQEAYAVLKHPLFVNDAGWYIEAYKGFPGPFVKYMEKSFSADDFLNLMNIKENKKVLFREVNCYIDEKGPKTFEGEITGMFTTKARGSQQHTPLKRVVSLRADGKSIAECWDEEISPTDTYSLWENMASWLQTVVQ